MSFFEMSFHLILFCFPAKLIAKKNGNQMKQIKLINEIKKKEKEGKIEKFLVNEI